MSTKSIGFDLFARDRASDKFDKVGKSASDAGSKFAKMGKLAKVGGIAVAAGAVLAAKALVDMTRGAIDDQAAQVKLARQLKNSAGATKVQVAATEDWITAQGKALGVSDDELRPALSKLAAATHNVGKSQRLASLAMDISAGSGKSLEAVSAALAKAQNGSVAGLTRLGIKTKESVKDQTALKAANIAVTTAQNAYTKAVKDNGEGSAEAALAAKKLDLAQTKLGDAQNKVKTTTISAKEAMGLLAKTYGGQAAAAAETTAGKFQRLKVMLSETGESIGYKLIPVATKLADFMLNDLGPALGKAGAWAKANLLPPMQKVGSFIRDKVIPAARELGEKVLTGLRGFIDNVSKSMQKNRPFLEALAQGFGKVAQFVLTKVVPALAWVASKALPILGTAIGLAITGLRGLSSGFLGMAIFGVKAFRVLLNASLSTFGGILHAASIGLGWIPGIGGKIKAAADSFDKFKDRTVAALDRTAAALQRTKDKIDGIPTSKTFHLNYVITSTGTRIPKNPAHGIGINARGTSYWRGGLSWVGEEGPELVDIPTGSKVHTAGASARMAGQSRAAKGDTYVINIHGVTDAVGAGREIEKVLQQYTSASGRPLQVRTA